MSRFLWTMLMTAVLILAARSAPRLKDRPSDATYWPTTVGTTREYETDTGTEVEVVTAVERVDGVTTVTTAIRRPDGRQTPSNRVEVRQDGIYMTEEAGQPYDPPWCVLRLPPKAGDTWAVDTRRPDCGRLRFTQTVGETKVIEAGGEKFEAVRVMGEDIAGGGRSVGPIVYWYAKKVGLVRIDGHRTLKAYSPGK
jgi:hypothetical protein